MKETITLGKLTKYGSFQTITLSTKSVPGDGKHGNGTKGGKGFSFLFM